VTRAVGKLQLVKSFLAMETGGHLATDANSYFRIDKWRVEPDDVDHLDLSGRSVPVQTCSAEVVPSAMTLLG